MIISCVICSDIFLPHSEIHTTQCGHMFHFTCLMNWLERSKTCPQCRNKCTEKTIHRVYFNLTNTDHIVDDVATLSSRIDALKFDISLRDKDIKIYKDKYNKMKNQAIGLREEVKDLESKERVSESAIHALKEQLIYFKKKNKETENQNSEIERLKNKIKDLEHVNLAINGSREQVNEIIRTENNIESLAILVTTLKKTLLDAENRKRNMEFKLRRSENDVARCRQELSTLKTQNQELKTELNYTKSSWETEKQRYKDKIAELNKKLLCRLNDSELEVLHANNVRMATQSPATLKRKPCLNATEDFIDLSSPTVPEKVKKILSSDSPYLPVKSSSVVNYNSILNTKFVPKTSENKYSIFKETAATTLENIKFPTNTSDVSYNGLGGSSKEHVFPSPKPLQTGLKRPKSASSLSSSKFRKLAPTSSKQKVTNYLNSADDHE